MERDAIAFRIDHNGAKAVFADLLSRAQDFPAVLSRSFDRFIQAAFDQQINQRPICGRRVIDASAIAAHAKTTRRVLFSVRQQSVFRAAFRQLLDLFTKNSGIKLYRAIKIGDGNVGPTKSVCGHSLRYQQLQGAIN